MNNDEDSTNAMFSVDLANLPPYQMGVDAIYDDIAKTTTCLPRFTLYTKGKAIDRRLIKSGHYGIPESATEITDLGPSIDLLVLARRPKAVDMSDSHEIITSFDPESAKFTRIAAKSLETWMVKDCRSLAQSAKPVKKYRSGPRRVSTSPCSGPRHRWARRTVGRYATRSRAVVARRRLIFWRMRCAAEQLSSSNPVGEFQRRSFHIR